MPWATNRDIRIHYAVTGSGTPLVLHPGFIGSAEDWREAGYVDALRGRYRLVMLDPRGQGRSDAPHEPEAYAVAHRVEDVLAVLDAVGIGRAHFWGYSMGGGLGLSLGLRAAGRLRALVLGAGNPFSAASGADAPDWLLERLRGGIETLVREMDAAGPDIWLSPGERTRWLEADADALSAARTQRLREPYCRPEDLGAIRVPTLLYAGTADREEIQMERIARLLPHASCVDLGALDHAQTLARSDLVLPHVLAFLARVERGPPMTSNAAPTEATPAST